MKPNSTEMLETAQGLFERYGGWDEARAASTTVNGVHVVGIDVDAIDAALERLSLVSAFGIPS